MVHTQLMIILGLCWDKKESLTSKIFCSKAMQFFGRISMSLYLVHEPLIFYIQLCFYGNLNWEDNKGKPPLPSPIWTVPIHITLSLILGIFITIFIEEPARKKFKEWNEKLKDSKDNLSNENTSLVCKHADKSTNWNVQFFQNGTMNDLNFWIKGLNKAVTIMLTQQVFLLYSKYSWYFDQFLRQIKAKRASVGIDISNKMIEEAKKVDKSSDPIIYKVADAKTFQESLILIWWQPNTYFLMPVLTMIF